MNVVVMLMLVFLIVCMIVVSKRFKRRDLPTIIMVFVLMAAAISATVLSTISIQKGQPRAWAAEE